MRFRDHEVWLAYDGVRAPELAPSIPDAQSPDHTAKVHVMSEVDKVFSINWRHPVSQTLLSISIRMDGILVFQHVTLPTSDGGQLCGIVSGARSIRPFVFAKIPRLEPEDIELVRADPVAVPGFGTIRVTIVPIHCGQGALTAIDVGGPLCGNVSPSPRSDMHCISLDAERPFASKGGPGGRFPFPAIPIMPPFDMQLMDEKSIVFEFHYGPLVCLQAIGAVPARTVVAQGDPANASPLTPSLQAIGAIPARTVVAQGDTANVSPLTPTPQAPTTLGKRSRSQFEDMSSLSVADVN